MRGRPRSSGPRGESGQTAVEYAGLLLLIALLVTALFRLGLPARIVAWGESAAAVFQHQSDQVASSTPGGSGTGPGGSGGTGPGGSGNGPGGSGSGPGGSGNGPGGSGGNGPGGSGNGPGGSGNGPGGSGNGPGGSGNGPGGSGNGPGGSGNGPGGSGKGPGGSGGQTSAAGGSDWIPCNTRKELPGCAIQAAVAPNGFREGIKDRARDRYRTAMRNMRNTSARPGTPEFNRLHDEVVNSRNDLLRSRTITENPLLKNLAGARKFFDPRFKDAQPILSKLKDLGKRTGDTPFPVAPGNGVRPPAGAASKVLGGLGKFGKGLGAVGLAFGTYSNVKNDGVGKGLFETGAGALGGWAGAAGVGALCAAAGVATAGVGAVACGIGALVVATGAGMVASKAAGWAWDRGSDLVNWGGHQISSGVQSVAHKVSGPLKTAGKGLSSVGHALSGFL